MSANSRLKASKIIGQSKAFYRQKIADSRCARKENIDTEIVVTSWGSKWRIKSPAYTFL